MGEIDHDEAGGVGPKTLVETNRDRSIGAEWLAWWAITEGDEPVECVAEYLTAAAGKLGDLSHALRSHLSSADEEFLAGLQLVLIALDAAANGGDTFNALHFDQRQGRRPNRMTRARGLDRALRLYEKLRTENWKANSAALEVKRLTGISRSTLLDWRRTTLKQKEALGPFEEGESK